MRPALGTHSHGSMNHSRSRRSLSACRCIKQKIMSVSRSAETMEPPKSGRRDGTTAIHKMRALESALHGLYRRGLDEVSEPIPYEVKRSFRGGEPLYQELEEDRALSNAGRESCHSHVHLLETEDTLVHGCKKSRHQPQPMDHIHPEGLHYMWRRGNLCPAGSWPTLQEPTTGSASTPQHAKGEEPQPGMVRVREDEDDECQGLPVAGDEEKVVHEVPLCRKRKLEWLKVDSVARPVKGVVLPRAPEALQQLVQTALDRSVGRAGGLASIVTQHDEPSDDAGSSTAASDVEDHWSSRAPVTLADLAGADSVTNEEGVDLGKRRRVVEARLCLAKEADRIIESLLDSVLPYLGRQLAALPTVDKHYRQYLDETMEQARDPQWIVGQLKSIPQDKQLATWHDLTLATRRLITSACQAEGHPRQQEAEGKLEDDDAMKGQLRPETILSHMEHSGAFERAIIRLTRLFRESGATEPVPERFDGRSRRASQEEGREVPAGEQGHEG